MAKDKKVEEIKSSEGLNKLKNMAKQMTGYLNQQYKDAIAYTPDTEKVESIKVHKWVEMPKAFQNITGLPGMPIGNITACYGKPDTGKTTLLMEAIVACQKQNILPILILTEHKFDFSRLSTYMGADPEAMLVLHADNLEQAYHYIDKILRDLQNAKLVFESDDGDVEIDVSEQDVYIMWDSVGNTLSESELDYEVNEWSKSMGQHAKAIRSLTKRINQRLSKVRQRAGVLILNQSYQSMPSYGPSVETPYGGDGIPYSSALVLRLRRVGDLKMTIQGVETVIGLETKIEIKKNHISHKRPIGSVYTVASGMLEADKDVLDAYKKKFMR